MLAEQPLPQQVGQEAANAEKDKQGERQSDEE
jgi:hypothetical protein